MAPDDEAIRQITLEQNSPMAGLGVSELRWPEEPLRSSMIRGTHGYLLLMPQWQTIIVHARHPRPCAGMCARMNIAEFARKYPKVLDQLLRSLLELVCRYHAINAGCAVPRRAERTVHQLNVACREAFVAGLLTDCVT